MQVTVIWSFIYAKVLSEIPDDTAVNVKLYRFTIQSPARTASSLNSRFSFIADAVRQEGALFDYFIDTAGELEEIIEGLADLYNKEYPNAPIKV